MQAFGTPAWWVPNQCCVRDSFGTDGWVLKPGSFTGRKSERKALLLRSGDIGEKRRQGREENYNRIFAVILTQCGKIIHLEF